MPSFGWTTSRHEDRHTERKNQTKQLTGFDKFPFHSTTTSSLLNFQLRADVFILSEWRNKLARYY